MPKNIAQSSTKETWKILLDVAFKEEDIAAPCFQQMLSILSIVKTVFIRVESVCIRTEKILVAYL